MSNMYDIKKGQHSVALFACYEILQMLITAKRPSLESLFTVFGVL